MLLFVLLPALRLQVFADMVAFVRALASVMHTRDPITNATMKSSAKVTFFNILNAYAHWIFFNLFFLSHNFFFMAKTLRFV